MTVEFGSIRKLQRAIFAQVSPLCGSRAAGQARAVALPFDGDTPPDPIPPVTLPRNSYLVPIIDGKADPSRLYKVASNPATVTAGSIASGHWTGGDWVFDVDTNGLVDIQANLGGATNNIPAGTVLAFDPPIVGFAPTVTVETDITNGTDVHALIGQTLLKRVVFWQALPTASAAAEFFKAGTGQFPAMLMVWLRSQTLQGRTSGGTQGNTRLGRGQRAFRESFQMFFAGGTYTGAEARQNEGLLAMEAACALLTDQQNNVDMESLSSMGAGLEITERALAVADREKFIYQVEFEVNQVVSKAELRSFGPWDSNLYNTTLPGRDAPEPTTPLELVVDAEDDMP